MFEVWGFEYIFNLGVSLVDVEISDMDFGVLFGFDVMLVLFNWMGMEVVRLIWVDFYQVGFIDIIFNCYYGVLQLVVIEDFDFVLGVSFVDYENEGEFWGVLIFIIEDGSSLYIGFIWEVWEDFNFYGSYSDIYQLQYYLNEDFELLGLVEGCSYELGVKKCFDNNLLISFVVFRIEQENLYEFIEYGDGDGIDDDDYLDDFNYVLYCGVIVDLNGFELEVFGQVLDEWFVQGGFIVLIMDDEVGNEVCIFIFCCMLKLLVDYILLWEEKLKVGVLLRW